MPRVQTESVKTKISRPAGKSPRETAPQRKSISMVRAKVFGGEQWLLNGFSTRKGGTSKVYGGNALNLGITREDTKPAVEKNRELLQKRLRASGWPLVHMHQVHSDIIHRVDAAGATRTGGSVEPGLRPEEMRYIAGNSAITSREGKPLLVGDGLVTDAPGLLLAVKTADCMPIIIVDPKKRAVGVFHAGWRGTLNRIAEKGVGEMRRWFGSRPQDLKAALGPSIRNCCYNVGEEVRDHFRSQFGYADELFREWQTYEDIHLKYPLLFLTMRAPGHSELPYRIFLDLAQANRRQLLDAGLREANIETVDACTSCDTKRFFSHRREKGLTGRMMAVVGIRAQG